MKPGTSQTLGWLVASILLVCYLSIQVLPLLSDGETGVVGLASHANDYKHVYLSSVLLSEGLSPYDPQNMLTVAGAASVNDDPRFRTILPYVYLPFTGLVMRPLSLFPFAQSVVVFQLVNHLLVLVALGVVTWASGLWSRWGSWSIALALATVAFNTALFRQNNAGQLNVVLMLCWALVYTAEKRSWHPAVAGVVAAFGALFKLSPGILILWFLLRRRWMEALWMTVAGAVLMGISVGVYGVRVHLDFLPVLKDMGYGRSTWAEFGHTFWRDAYNQSFNALFHRSLVAMPGSEVAPLFTGTPALANGLTWVCSLGILSAFAFASWRDRSVGGAASWAACLGASLLLPSICWDHYLVQLLPAVLVLAAMSLDTGRRRALCLILLAGAVALISWHVRFETFGGGIGLVLGSLKLPAALLVFALGVIFAIRSVPTAPTDIDVPEPTTV
ncbi:DUF2029 domain-containing protein [bacterium]|nr:DUF2029 domain-containing protein [bacterium]